MALYYGRDQANNFVAKISRRSPPHLNGGGRTPSGPPPLAKALREELSTLGFQVGQRGLRRTRYAGQYPTKLRAAWAE
eukprot:8294349-Pyramimonas_sp.AAC.1